MSLSQTNRSIAIQTPLGDDVLGLRSIVVKEQLSRPFEIEAQFSSLDPDINFDEIVGHPVIVSLNLASGPPRLWHAIVSRFTFVGQSGQFFHYQATLVPWLWALTRTADCRIFQEKTIPDIVQTVLRDAGLNDFELRLTGNYPTWEYCVQYRETEFNFVSRLLEQEGIAYYFQHTEEKCRLILADDKSAYDPSSDFAELFYRPDSGDARLEDTVTSWKVERLVQPTKYILNDFNFNVPNQSLIGVAQISRAHALNDGKVFDYPGAYTAFAEGERLAQIRLEELQAGLDTIKAQTSCSAVTAGMLVALKDHPRADQNREYLITSVRLYHDAGEFSSEEPVAPKARCEFTAIPSEQSFRPSRVTPKPIVQGPQTAIVVGPAGSEIYTDPQGRVKVHFHWDRYGQRNEKSSCWIRVSQTNAGKGWGSMITPRIDQEVIVEFLEGDPDRPIITGRVYNGDQRPPYGAGQGVVSGLKSQTHKGAGANEMTMDDTAGKEKLTLNGQYDMHTTVGNNQTNKVAIDQTNTVGVNQTEDVGANRKVDIGANDTLTVKGNRESSITGNIKKTVSGKEDKNVAGPSTVSVGGKSALTVGGKRSETIAGSHTIMNPKMMITSGTSYTVAAGAKLTQTSPKVNFLAGAKFLANSGGKMDVKAAAKMTQQSGAAMNVKSGAAYKLQSAAAMNMKSGAAMKASASGAMNMKSGGAMTQKGSVIKLNSPTKVKGTTLTVS